MLKIEQRYEEVLRLASLYPEPPSGFDPLTAPDHQLARFGLPERPPRGSDSETVTFWEEMLGPPTEFVQPEFPYKTEHPRIRAYVHEQQPLLRLGFDHAENSRNWSGAYITPIRPNRFLQVSGSRRRHVSPPVVSIATTRIFAPRPGSVSVETAPTIRCRRSAPCRT